MRPVAVSDAFQGRSRKSSLADNQVTTSWTDPRNAAPTTFFLARESDLEKQEEACASTERDGLYGVQSLEEAVGEAVAPVTVSDTEDLSSTTKRRSTIKPTRTKGPSRDRSSSAGSNSHVRSSPDVPPSQPLTPLFLASPGEPSSLPSSPKSMSARSLRPSEDESGVDESSSQAITSGGEDEDVDEHQPSTVSALQDSAPQLIMPSIKMPSRRPFTQRGKETGKYKILIAGATGEPLRLIVPDCSR